MTSSQCRWFKLSVNLPVSTSTFLRPFITTTMQQYLTPVLLLPPDYHLCSATPIRLVGIIAEMLLSQIRKSLYPPQWAAVCIRINFLFHTLVCMYIIQYCICPLSPLSIYLILCRITPVPLSQINSSCCFCKQVM